MSISELRLIKHFMEHLPKTEIPNVPGYTRGIYVLFKYIKKKKMYDVVYIGMAGGEKAGIRGRLKKHEVKKGRFWSHFSIFQVWDNIREEEVAELEGIFRHIYRKDTRANKLNKQKSFNKLKRIQEKSINEEWM